MSNSRTRRGTTPPGWYGDPDQSGRGRRYWDGRTWTAHFEHPASNSSVAEPPPSPTPIGTPATSSPMTVQQTVINVGSQKSGFGAVILTFFFGPLGMLYTTVPGALVMFVVDCLIILVGVATLGVGLVLLLVTRPIEMIWAGVAASSHNSRLGVSSQVVQPVGATASAGGWHDDPDGSGRLRYWDGSRWTHHYSDKGEAAKQSPKELPAKSGQSEQDAGVIDSTSTRDVEPSSSKQAFCASCGKGIQVSDSFCPACGEKQEVEVAEA